MGKLRILFVVVAVVGLIGCDHATKSVAAGRLSARGPIVLVRDVLELRYAENRETAFSLTRGLDLPHKTRVLGLFALLGCAVAAGVAWRRRGVASRLELGGYALVVAGGLGNAIDRLASGYVVDFIHLRHWPVFNVADILVVLGAVALVLGMRDSPRRPSLRAGPS